MHPFERIEDRSISFPLEFRFSFSREENQFLFGFELRSVNKIELESQLHIPPLVSLSDQGRKDELWRQTCLEFFVSSPQQTSYLEFNLAPTGQWNCYGFESYRQGMRWINEVSLSRLQTHRSPEGDFFRWSGQLQFDLRDDLQDSFGILNLAQKGTSLVIGASAVLQYREGDLEFWALHHNGKRPDFHDRNGFCLHLKD